MDPLAQLQDIHVPEAVNLWPLAWGWWALFAIALAGTIITIFLVKRYKQKRIIRKAAMRELELLDTSTPDFIEHANALLKRTCIGYFDIELVSSLYGEKWRRFLVSMLPKDKQETFDVRFKTLQMHLYRNDAAKDSNSHDSTKELVADWLKHALPPKASNFKEPA